MRLLTTGWVKIALQPSVQRRAASVALVVGTLLALLNHFDELSALSSTALLQIALTYLVPYAVSVYSSVGASVSQEPTSN